jgi:multiple sugar transport system substrate-binding protein
MAACGNPSDGPSDSAKSINVILDNHPWANKLIPLIPEFEKQSGIKVNYELLAEQQMKQKIQLNLQSKSNTMDVFESLPAIEGRLFASSGYYENLEPFIEKDRAAMDFDDFAPGARDAMKPDGKTIGLPENVESSALFYRKDLLEKYSIEVPTTMDELNAALQIIKDKGEVIPIVLRGHPDAMAGTFGPIFHAYDVNWTKPDGTANFDDPKAIQGVAQYIKLAKDFGPPGVTNNTFTQSSALFSQGKAAFELESSNEVGTLTSPESSTVADNVGVTTVPVGPAGKPTPTITVWGVAMSPYSEAKDEAWEFMKWATSKQTELELAKNGIAPPRSSVGADPAYTDTLTTPAQKQWLSVIQAVYEFGNPEASPMGVQTQQMRTVLGNAMGKGFLGQASPEEVAAEIQTNLAPLLDK